MTMKELQAEAEKHLGVQFDWFNKAAISIGIFWEAPYMVIIDMAHPQGQVIESVGEIDPDIILIFGNEATA